MKERQGHTLIQRTHLGEQGVDDEAVLVVRVRPHVRAVGRDRAQLDTQRVEPPGVPVVLQRGAAAARPVPVLAPAADVPAPRR